jgi:hypothetical protein
MTTPPFDLFVCYTREDEDFCEELTRHLVPLCRQGVIRDWNQQKIVPGDDIKDTVRNHLQSAHIIVLLVSVDFLASDICYEEEMKLALERQLTGEVCVIPIILRECYWDEAPFANLQALPKGAKPVSTWLDRDQAWKDVVQGIRNAIEKLAESPGKVEPSYDNELVRSLSSQLEAAYVRRRHLLEAGYSSKNIDGEILDLRRRLREGGTLRAGDSLGNGRYLLLEPVGRGGFAVVWKALDRLLNKIVAIKVLHSNLAGDQLRIDRFFRGARRMAEIQHKAVVRVLKNKGDDNGFLYFVMEFISGGNLREAVVSNRLPKDQVIPIVLRIGEALELAHSLKLIHRDVKPENILLDMWGVPYLTDFDLVFGPDTTGGTKTGALGTIVYAAPEIWERPQTPMLRQTSTVSE